MTNILEYLLYAQISESPSNHLMGPISNCAEYKRVNIYINVQYFRKEYNATKEYIYWSL